MYTYMYVYIYIYIYISQEVHTVQNRWSRSGSRVGKTKRGQETNNNLKTKINNRNLRSNSPFFIPPFSLSQTGCLSNTVVRRFAEPRSTQL